MTVLVEYIWPVPARHRTGAIPVRSPASLKNFPLGHCRSNCRAGSWTGSGSAKAIWHAHGGAPSRVNQSKSRAPPPHRHEKSLIHQACRHLRVSIARQSISPVQRSLTSYPSTASLLRKVASDHRLKASTFFKPSSPANCVKGIRICPRRPGAHLPHCTNVRNPWRPCKTLPM